jgi:mono/diheme cytochrome c family protein
MMSCRAHRGTLRTVSFIAGALLLTGCMDPKTDDTRGYTKAPLEHAGWVVKGEEAGAMRQLGTPNQTRAEIIEVAAKAPAAAAGPAKPAVLAPGVTEQMVTDGDKLFHSSTCIGCHGADAGGTPMAPALNDKAWINLSGSYDEITSTIIAGVPKPKEHPGPMPPKGGSALTDDEVKKVAAYIYSISH